MTLLTFNGVAMPAPTSYDVSLADIQSANSGRNDNGVMTMDVIRSNVATINVAWDMITTEELEKIQNDEDSFIEQIVSTNKKPTDHGKLRYFTVYTL